jgi:sterol desaturase/sphingolipid hydroxylase (fatty acid hydroxylase superfamily)
VPFFLLLIAVEIAWGLWRNNNTYRVNDAINSLSLGILSVATRLVSLKVGAVVFSAAEQNWALWHLDTGSAWAWLFGILLYDFLYYWFHRISHERQIFWASHVVHHQSEDYNLSTALRQTSTSFLLTWIFFVPCFLLGMPLYMYVTIAAAHLIYQFWVHTRHIPKLGFLEWFMITPSNHRVHHAQNSHYIDKNYGGLFIVWDRLFGTFTEEDEAEEIIYGISTPLSSWNPLWANIHIFAQMAIDAWRTTSRREKITIWVSRTGWRPADVARKYPLRKSDLDNFKKYDPPLTASALVAVLAHFVLITGVDTWFAWHAADMSYVIKAGYVGLLLYTLMVLGAVLNRSSHALSLELLRWAAVTGALVAAYISGLLTLVHCSAGMAYLLLSAPLMLWAVKSLTTGETAELLPAVSAEAGEASL